MSYRRKDILKDHEWQQQMVNDMINVHEGKWPMISEMAIPLKAYVAKIESFKYELVKNWCLCKWCQMFDPSNKNFNHWKEELYNFMEQMSAPKIKNNIGKKKHLKKYLIDWYELNDKDTVLDIIFAKFNKEKIIDKVQRISVAEAFINSIDDLIDAIDIGLIACDAYIQKTFN